MQLSLIIIGITIVLLVLGIIFKQSIKVKKIEIETFWIISLIGAMMLLVFNLISLKEVRIGITSSGAINPIKILIIFLSMTYLSICLDELGFFAYIANLAIAKAKGSQFRIFVYLYITISILTIFTSNDIIILTFTPFICYYTKRAKVNPLPYLIMEFVAANSWSMMLIIGNPTNIYLASSFKISFFEYLKVMFVPTIFAGLTSFIVVILLFRKSLSVKMEIELSPNKQSISKMTIFSLINLGLCTLFISLSTIIGLEMYLICIIFFLISIIGFLIYYLKNKNNVLINSIKRIPYSLIPFVLSMFVIVLVLNKYEITKQISNILENYNLVFSYGLTSFITANLINNIPMSVMYSSVIMNITNLTQAKQAIFASIISSNIGAFLTPIGALAGIMWIRLVKKENIKMSFFDFTKFGIIISIPTIIFALLGLLLVI